MNQIPLSAEIVIGNEPVALVYQEVDTSLNAAAEHIQDNWTESLPGLLRVEGDAPSSPA